MSNKVPKIIALVVAFTSVAVMIGWIFDITVLKSISPQFVTMKFISAVCFLLSSFSLYIIARKDKERYEWEDIVLLFINFLVILLMASLLISVFVGVKTGVEDLFVKEEAGAVKTTVPGRPALFTMINFVLIASIGLFGLIRKGFLKSEIIRILGLAVAFSGGLAIIGYIADVPKLYGHFNNFSTAMALHTSILFVFLGVGFFIVHGKKSQIAD